MTASLPALCPAAGCLGVEPETMVVLPAPEFEFDITKLPRLTGAEPVPVPVLPVRLPFELLIAVTLDAVASVPVEVPSAGEGSVPVAAQTAVSPTVPAENAVVEDPAPPEIVQFTPKAMDGIPLAKPVTEMKKAVTLERNAQPAGKELSPERVVVSERLAAVERDLKPQPTATAAPVVSQVETPVTVHRTTDTPPVIDRLGNRIAEEVVTFRKLGAQSVEVSVRPDGRTELSVLLTLRHGQVEVTAHVDRGDLTTLKSHWPELQQTLAQQGIRVNHLSEPAAGEAGLTFSDRQPAGQQHRFNRDRETEPVFIGAPTEPVGNRALRKAARGWEVWA